jgi:hypothetical protein
LKTSIIHESLSLVVKTQDAPEFWINREDYLEEGIACPSRFGQAIKPKIRDYFVKQNHIRV